MTKVNVKLLPCLCGNFGDDGADNYCDRPCECKEHGTYSCEICEECCEDD